MIIIAERINATRKNIKKALENKDKDFILKEAKNQILAGSDFIDLNTGLGKGTEKEDLAWLIQIIQDSFPDVKLCLDSSDTQAIKNGIPLVKNKPVMVNSINAEKTKMESLLPILKDHPDVYVVALTMDNSGIPKTPEKSIEIASLLYEKLTGIGIKEENIYFDSLVQTVSADPNAFILYLQALKGIKQKFPNTKSTCGMSNVSFGLPKRKMINQYALAIAVYEGLDSAILDPLDMEIHQAICVVDILTAKDQFCMNYLTKFREGKI